MKIEILQVILKEGLQLTSRISPKTFSLPILSNVLLTAEKNYLTLSTTDLEVGINFYTLAKIEQEGKITIPSKVITNFVNLLPEKKINLETKDNVLSIKYNNSQTEIKGQSGEDFPIIPKPGDLKPLSLDSQSFCQSLNQLVDIPLPSSARPEISGIYFSFEKELIKIVSTDSFRLGEKRIFYQGEVPAQPFSFILPQKAAREIINIFGDKEEELKIYFSPNQIFFEIPIAETNQPKIQLVSRLIEGEYPDYQAIIPKKYQTQLLLTKNEFLNQIRMASLFSGKINEIKFRIDPEGKKIEIFSQNPEIGEYQSFLSGEIKGEALKISFNWKFLIDGLLNIKTPEILIELNGEEGPAVLKGVGDESYLYVLMPIKTS